MSWLAPFFTSGRALDVALLVVALEAALLLGLRVRTGRGPAPRDLLGLLLPGVLLMLALRCALTGAPLAWTALLMTASFPAHLYDVVRRSRQGSARPQG